MKETATLDSRFKRWFKMIKKLEKLIPSVTTSLKGYYTTTEEKTMALEREVKRLKKLINEFEN